MVNKVIEVGVEAVQWQLSHHKLDAAMKAAGTVDHIAHRQPSKKKLRRIMSDLARDLEAVEETVAILSRDVVAYKNRTESRRRFLRNRTVSDTARKSLVLKYGFADFVDVVLSGLEGETKLSRTEVDLISAYRAFLEKGEARDKDFQVIERIVTERHEAELSRMENCDVSRQIRALRELGKD